LLEWYAESARSYPWRETTEPYHIFVAEFMLQRTSPGHVVPVFREFLKRYPTTQAAAEASKEEMEEVLTPLGLGHRIELLQTALRHLAGEYDGRIPRDYESLVSLPGVGPYKARAVLCFAYGEDLGLVDVNVVRVLGRALDLVSTRSRPHMDRELWSTVDAMIPCGRAADFNLALIDLGALVCRVRKPCCSRCPVLSICLSAEKTGSANAQRT